MPAAKPATLPRWATNLGVTTAPLSGHQDTGWTDGEQPSAEVWNWLENLDYQWAAYVNDFEIQAHTWTVAQTYSAGIIISGGGLSVVGGTTTDTLHATGAATLSSTLGVTGVSTLAALGCTTVHATGAGTFDADCTFGAKGIFAGDVVIDSGDANAGTSTKSLRFGGTGTGEFIASNRTAGTYLNGLELFTGNSARIQVKNTGEVNIPSSLTVGSLVVSAVSPTLFGSGGSTFTSPWGLHTGDGGLCFWKDTDSQLRLQGRASDGGVNTAGLTPILGTLPAGYRPAKDVGVACYIEVWNGSSSDIRTGVALVRSSGQIQVYAQAGVTGNINGINLSCTIALNGPVAP